MWKRFTDLLSRVADVLQIVGWLGVSAATVVGLLGPLLGWLSAIPTLWIVVGTLVAVGTTLFLTRQIRLRIGMVSLADGARQAYEQLRGTFSAGMAENIAKINRNEDASDVILRYFASAICKEVPVPPSTRLEKLTTSEITSGSFVEGGRVLQSYDMRTRIVDLTLRKSDLRKAIHQMKQWNRELPAQFHE